MAAGREDIAFVAGRRGEVQEVLFALANPELEGPLSRDRAERGIAGLTRLD